MKSKSVFWISGLLLAVILVTIAGCSSKNAQSKLPPPPPPISDTGAPPPAVGYWRQQFPQYQLVKWTPGFLNGDDQEDAVIIYRTGDKCFMVAVLPQSGSFQVTAPVPAPVSDQQIVVGNVENNTPNEIIVSGQKDGTYGYGIFCLNKNQLLEVYDAGMDQCC
jgi:hypothetical protein